MRLILRAAAIVLLSTACLVGQLHAQPTTGEEPRYPGTTGQNVPYDTSMSKELRQRAAESSVLLEHPLDPGQYMVGPSDQLTVLISTTSPMLYDLVISPDAKVIIPLVGEIDVRGLTLAQAKQAIEGAVGRAYRTPSVSVSLKRMRQFKVNVIGAVRHIGAIVATPMTRVSEAIDLAGGATPLASKRDVDIIRDGRTIPVDLVPYYAFGDLNSNPFIQGGDVIKVGVQDPKKVVVISGAVQRPGEFTYHPGDSVSTLIRFSFGFTVDALLDSIEVVSVDDYGDIIARNFYRAMPDGAIIGDQPLRVGDQIFVRSIEKYREMNRVVLFGELKHPGYYAIDPGHTKLRELIQRAGGFTSEASISDAVLIRRQMVERDPEYDRIAQIDPEKRTDEETEYFRVKNRERSGVITINFQQLMDGKETENVTLVNEDSLYVPRIKGFVKVSGKVKNPGNVTYKPGAGYAYYIDLAGGYGWRADIDNEQIIKGKTGEKFLASNTEDYTLESGDAIFVPEEPPGDFWTGFTTAIAVTAQLMTILAVVVNLTK